MEPNAMDGGLGNVHRIAHDDDHDMGENRLLSLG